MRAEPASRTHGKRVFTSRAAAKSESQPAIRSSRALDPLGSEPRTPEAFLPRPPRDRSAIRRSATAGRFAGCVLQSRPRRELTGRRLVLENRAVSTAREGCRRAGTHERARGERSGLRQDHGDVLELGYAANGRPRRGGVRVRREERGRRG